MTFHDGTPMTAEDVVFSFDRAMAEGSTNAQKQLFDGINEVTAIDDVTVEIGLDAPKGSLLFNLAWGDAVIVSPASADEQRDQAGRHRAVQVLALGAGRPGRAGAATPTTGASRRRSTR